MEIKYWTVLTKSGKTITETAGDDWLKHHTDVLVIAVMNEVKTIIIYD